MSWRFENTGRQSGKYNMEYDERLVRSLLGDSGTPTVRVYGWNPPAISLGYHQSMEDVDLERCRQSGIDVVRRPTGGRAILHSEEVTYCVAMPTSGKSVLTIYNEISRALLRGLDELGARIEFQKSQPHFPTLYKSPSSSACFSSSARYELQIRGKKLVGSAQRRFVASDGREVVLQHGSILLGSDHKRIVQFLRLPRMVDQQILQKEMDEKTIDLSSAKGVTLTFDEVAPLIKKGFEQEWQIRFEDERMEASAYNAISPTDKG
ncbi:MAG: lipoate--protein ligase family protein [bacterium]